MFAICMGFLLVLLAAGPMWSATFSGRLTASAYSWQAQEAVGVDARHLRLYQVALLNLGQLGGRALSLHTHLQFSGDVSDEISGREHYRIYSAYARLQPDRYGLDVRLGRQRIFDGVGFGTVDGVRAVARPVSWLGLVGYAGMLAPFVPDDGIGTWDEGHLWGGQALIDFRETFLTVSYAERSREPLAYLGPGRYTGVLLNNDGKQFRRLGFDLRRDWDRGSVYGRVDLDADDWGLQEVEVAGEVQVSDALQLAAEFEHRKPTLYLNSILSVFEVQDNREVEARATYKLSERALVLVRGTRTFYDGDSAWQLGGGLILGQVYVGYARRMGYSGDNDSFTASVQQPLNRQWTLRADGSVASYRVFEGGERDRAMAGTVGLRFQPRRTLSLDVEAQVLRNAFYNRDARVFVRGSFWFFKRQPQGETGR